MLLIISPSKTQNFDFPIRGDYTLPLFLDQTKQLARQLKQLAQPQLAALMKMSDKLAALSYQRFQDFQFPFRPTNSRQALLMFRGDQFDPMAVDSYSDEQFAHAQHHLRILSGLYGMLRPLDLMQPYRLEMATKLAVGEAKNLYSFWGDLVTRKLNNKLSEDSQPVLINLASAEYFKVIRRKELHADILTLSFKQEKEGKLKTIAIYAKRARGAIVDFVIRNRITRPIDLQGFNRDGYRFKSDLSTDNEWVFVRIL
jgi:cytoplasmic iron level regulating protein YaaA (DUF328/UPF0246 family)